MNFKDDEKKENFEVLQNFIGYGNPKSNYWFIGIEEGGNWNGENIHELDDYKQIFIDNEPYSFKELSEEKIESDKKSGTMRGIKNFLVESLKITDFKEIYNNAFIGNLLPLANIGIDEPYPKDDYSKFFGIESREFYLDSIFYKERLTILSNFINLHIFDGSNNQRYLIFHGKTYWDYFKCFIDNCLHKKRNDFIIEDKLKYCKIEYENVFIVLVPHLSRFTLTMEMIENITRYR